MLTVSYIVQLDLKVELVIDVVAVIDTNARNTSKVIYKSILSLIIILED